MATDNEKAEAPPIVTKEAFAEEELEPQPAATSNKDIILQTAKEYCRVSFGLNMELQFSILDFFFRARPFTALHTFQRAGTGVKKSSGPAG